MHATEDLGALGFYDLLRVHTHCFQFDNSCVSILTPVIFFFLLFFILGVGADEGPPRQVHGQRGGNLPILQVLGDRE